MRAGLSAHGDSPLSDFRRRVQLFDDIPPPLFDNPAFHFQRRRELAACDCKFGGDQREAFDPLEPCARGVHRVDRFLEESHHVRSDDERFACPARAAERGETALECLEVRHEERGNERAAITKEYRFSDQRLALQLVFPLDVTMRSVFRSVIVR
jgi:hypothetical protein